MFGNGKIFISHAHDDNQRCQPLLAALDAWQSDYWFDTQELDAGQRFSDRIQQAVNERDIFLRIGTMATLRSFWMNRELRAVRGLQEAFPQYPRLIIHLALTPDYVADAGTQNEVIIDTTETPRADWLRDLHHALGYTVERRVTRRSAIGIGATSLVAVAATVIAGKLYFTPPDTVNLFKPQGSPRPITPQSGDAHLRWHYNLDDEAIALSAGGTGAIQISLAADTTALYVTAEKIEYIRSFAQKDGAYQWSYPKQTNLNLSDSFVQASENAVFLLANMRTSDGTAIPFTLYALENATGKVKWQIPVEASAGSYYSKLCVTDTAIYFQADGRVYAYKQDGTKLWVSVTLFTNNDTSFQQQNYSTPAVANGLLYLGMSDGKLYALDATTGKVRWVTPVTTALKVGDPTFSSTVPQVYPLSSSPAVSEGVVIIGAVDSYCYGFDAATGALRWKQQLVTPDFTSDIAFAGSPTTVDGVMYIQAGIYRDESYFVGGVFLALDVQSGKVLWKVDPLKLSLSLPTTTLTAIPNDAPPLISAISVYFTMAIILNNDIVTEQVGPEYLIVLDKNTGALQWSYNAGISNFVDALTYFPSSPVSIPGGVAFTSNQPTVYVFDL